MQKGVDKCDALVLIMTPGIFDRERHWVTHTEIKYAIDSGKPIILIDGGFKFDKQSTCPKQHKCLKEFANTSEEFQPYARAMLRALEVIPWHGDQMFRQTCLEKFEVKFEHRHSQKLQEYLGQEKAFDACPCCKPVEEVKLPEKWRKIEPLPLAAPKLCQHFQNRPELLSGILQEIKSGGNIARLVNCFIESYGSKQVRIQQSSTSCINLRGMCFESISRLILMLPSGTWKRDSQVLEVAR